MDNQEYERYISLQKSKSFRTQSVTIKYEGRREWIYQRMIELGINGSSILCCGARHYSEIEFFEKKGFKTDGIDLFKNNKIIECDMSKMLEHSYIKEQKYDIVFCHEVMEHCLNLKDFIKGLNQICRKYFICMGPSGGKEQQEKFNVEWWDCAVHNFMVNVEDEEEYILNIRNYFC